MFVERLVVVSSTPPQVISPKTLGETQGGRVVQKKKLGTSEPSGVGWVPKEMMRNVKVSQGRGYNTFLDCTIGTKFLGLIKTSQMMVLWALNLFSIAIVILLSLFGIFLFLS